MILQKDSKYSSLQKKKIITMQYIFNIIYFAKYNFFYSISSNSSRSSLTLTRRLPVTARSSFTCTPREGRSTPPNTWTASSVSSSWTRRNGACTSAGIRSASDPVLNLTLNRRGSLPSALRLKVFFSNSSKGYNY